MLTRKALYSGIIVLASPTWGVSLLALSPVDRPVKPQCHGKPTWCTTRPFILKGLKRLVTTATTVTSPRADLTLTFRPFLMPFSSASSSLSQQRAQAAFRLATACFLSSARPASVRRVGRCCTLLDIRQVCPALQVARF